MEERSIESVLRECTDMLMALPGVVGTAQGECAGRSCIRIFVAKKTADLLRQIPETIEGYRVAVDETGAFNALDEPD